MTHRGSRVGWGVVRHVGQERQDRYVLLVTDVDFADIAFAEEAGLSTSAAEPEGPTFLAFAGSGQRLDGKSAAPAAPVPVRLGTYEVR